MFKEGDIVKSIDIDTVVNIGGLDFSDTKITKFKIVSLDEQSSFLTVKFLNNDYSEIKYKYYGKVPKDRVELDTEYYRNKKLNKINNKLKQ